MNMIRSIKILLSVLVLASSSEAALLAYEGFEYDEGVLNGKGGGVGWSANWDTDANYSVVSNSLMMDNLPFSSVGNAMIGTSSITASRTFTNSNSYGFHKNDNLFISFLIQKTVNGGVSQDWALLRPKSESGTQAAQIGIDSAERFATRVDGAPWTWVTSGLASTSETYFVVAKLVGSTAVLGSHADNIYIKVYDESDEVDLSEPSGWTRVGVGYDNGITLGQIAFDIGNNTTGIFDEIRIGEEWEDVVPIEDHSRLLIAYEGFDYSPGALDGMGSVSNGWSGDWEDSSSNYVVGGSSLEMANLPFLTHGGAVVGDSTIAMRDFDSMFFNKDGVYYLSFIMKKTGSASVSQEWGNLLVRTATGTGAIRAGISSDERFEERVEASPWAYFRAGSALTNETYFLVAKVETSLTGDDVAYLKVYSETNSIDLVEPINWTISAVTNSSLNLTCGEIALDVGDNTTATFDEIRIGRSWESVVPTDTIAPVIVSLTPFGANLEMVVSTLSASKSFPKYIDSLNDGTWTNIGHSIDGSEPFIHTNLSYSTEAGANKVIYLKGEDSSRFFKIDVIE